MRRMQSAELAGRAFFSTRACVIMHPDCGNADLVGRLGLSTHPWSLAKRRNDRSKGLYFEMRLLNFQF